MENLQESNEIHLSNTEKPNYKRLYGVFNRETIAKMTDMKMEVTEEPYNIDEVFRYLSSQEDRARDQFENRNAMKAQLFAEWLQEKGISLPESTEISE